MESLPIELLHRIFDDLDIETIFFSIRPLSRLFLSVVTTYDRYVLNMKLISKPKFYLLCRLIKPENVTSLMLSNDERTSDQIYLFISLVRIQQFTRLHSLTLLEVDEVQLNFILKRINLNIFTSFSFNIRKFDHRCIKTTNKFLASILSQSNLRRLEFGIENTKLSKVSWPFNCTFQYLTINNYITMDNLVTVLQCSPHLHTIIMKKNFDEHYNDSMSTFSSLIRFPQLRSLTIEQLNVPFFKLESFLLLTPSLSYLKLISGSKIFDGKLWEQFIQINLSELNKFEFFCNEWFSNKNTVKDLELIISSFRTPFWTEQKQWFVIGEYDADCSYNIRLYSVPICKYFFKYTPEFGKVSLSTCDRSTKSKLAVMDNVNSLTLTLNKLTVDDIREKKYPTNSSLFPNVSEIEIVFYSDCSLFSLQSFSIFINIEQVVQIKLESNCFNEYNKNIFSDIDMFLAQAHNLLSLCITSSSNEEILSRTVQNIHQLIPRQLKYLEIQISNSNQIKDILQKCENLSIIKFDVNFESEISEEIIQWFNNNTINSTCKKIDRTITIWLGKKNIPESTIRVYNTRKKLTCNRSDSNSV